MSGLTEGLEDYLEAMLLEEKERRFVRTKDLARRLGVTSPSVNAAVRELGKLGLVAHEAYGHIDYRLFADVLKVPEKISESHACGMEHHLDAETVKRLARLLDFLKRKSGKSGAFAAELREALGRD
jgi:DtxR family Mn-dependent transcriptional regulator